MKTIVLSFASLAVLTQIAAADKRTIKPVSTKVVDKPLVMNFGESFEQSMLKSRRTALPTDRETIETKTLSTTQVDKVVKDRVDELEYCWLRVPAAKRTHSSAIVKLSVEAIGIVETVEVQGELPAGVSKCIASVATRWRFPVGDQPTTVEYPIGLNATITQ